MPRTSTSGMAQPAPDLTGVSGFPLLREGYPVTPTLYGLDKFANISVPRRGITHRD